jgi:hypothetical protein
MSEFPVEGGENGDMQTVMENFQKKNNLVTGRTHHVSHHPQVTTTSSQVIIRDTCILFSVRSLSLPLSLPLFFKRLPSMLADAAKTACLLERGKGGRKMSLIFLDKKSRCMILCAQRTLSSVA